MDKGSVAGHYNLGVTYVEKGMDGQTREMFQKAVGNDAGSLCAVARTNLAVVLQKEGKVEEALKYYELALDINANDAITLGGLGEVLMGRKEWGRALEMLSEMRAGTGRCGGGWATA